MCARRQRASGVQTVPLKLGESTYLLKGAVGQGQVSAPHFTSLAIISDTSTNLLKGAVGQGQVSLPLDSWPPNTTSIRPII
jgi:hypothetical protein